MRFSEFCKSLTLINNERELFFLSSNPSIEQNLIEKELWEYDSIYQDPFIYQNELKLWSELSPLAYPELLRRYKLHNQKLIDGISIPVDYGCYRAIFSFGFKKMNSLLHIKSNNCEKLIMLGMYCLNKINKGLVSPPLSCFHSLECYKIFLLEVNTLVPLLTSLKTPSKKHEDFMEVGFL